MNLHKSIYNYINTYRFLLVLIFLVLLLFVPVYIPNPYVRKLMVYLFLTMLLFFNIIVFPSYKKSKLYIGYVTFIVFVMLINWVDYFYGSISVVDISRLFFVEVVFVAMFVSIFREFRKREKVDMDFIFGVISAYLIMGVFFSYVSVLIDRFYPSSFGFGCDNIGFHDYVYYNFVTMTTLGYGDVLPLSSQGRMHSIIVTISGQFYMAITVATVVGRYLVDMKGKKQK